MASVAEPPFVSAAENKGWLHNHPSERGSPGTPILRFAPVAMTSSRDFGYTFSGTAVANNGRSWATPDKKRSNLVKLVGPRSPFEVPNEVNRVLPPGAAAETAEARQQLGLPVEAD
jgi:hypothetical protein